MTPRMHQTGHEDSVSAEPSQMRSAFQDILGLHVLKQSFDIHTLCSRVTTLMKTCPVHVE